MKTKLLLTAILAVQLSAYSQITVTLSTCGASTFTLFGTDGTGRNIYHDGSGSFAIQWSTASSRWEIVELPSSVGYANTVASTPNPPCFGTGTWQLIQVGCGDVTDFSGDCHSCTATTSTITQTACSSYTLNGQTYTTSGPHIQTLTNVAGCDSILTLNLTIKDSTTSSSTITACYSYVLNTQTYDTTGVYKQRLTNSVGCDSIITLNLTINRADTSVIQSGVILTSHAIGATYQWINCSNGSHIGGATNASYIVSATGDYAVIVTQNSCTDTSSCKTVIVTGIIENNFAGAIKIFPNPANRNFTITAGSEIKAARLEIFNLLGERIYSDEIKNSSTGFSQQIQLDASAGIYFVKVTCPDFSGSDGQNQFTQKLIIQ